jgi:hypothetical protein
MRPLAMHRNSATVAITGFSAAALQAFFLGYDYPIQQLKLAWTLTRVLLQL